MKPSLRDLIIAVLTAVITFLTASCGFSFSAEKLDVNTVDVRNEQAVNADYRRWDVV